MGKLLLLFIVVPAVELVLLIKIGQVIGALATGVLIVVTGIVGATLAKWQGLSVLQRLREETARGELPADSLLDGAFILVAGALLVTPGVLTDLFGFSCLVPPVRRVMKRVLLNRIRQAMEEGRMQVSMHVGGGFSPGSGPASPEQPEIIDVESRVVED